MDSLLTKTGVYYLKECVTHDEQIDIFRAFMMDCSPEKLHEILGSLPEHDTWEETITGSDVHIIILHGYNRYQYHHVWNSEDINIRITIPEHFSGLIEIHPTTMMDCSVIISDGTTSRGSYGFDSGDNTPIKMYYSYGHCYCS